MLDKALLNEGLPRCPLPRFLAWLGLLGLFMAWGLYATLHIYAQGVGLTNLNDRFEFGLWITVNFVLTAYGAGAFFAGLLRYLLNIKALEPIFNLAVLVGLLCYVQAVIVLAVDIGQPLRSWFGFWHPNVHSMLTEVIFCITCYLLVLFVEFIPLLLENRLLNRVDILRFAARHFHVTMPLLAALGAFLSFFHQGSLGGMFGVLFGRPFAFREGFFIWPWTFFLFVLSAAASGPCLTVLVCSAVEKASGRRLVHRDVKDLLGRIAGTVLALYVALKLADTWWWGTDTLPRQGMTFAEMYSDGYRSWLLWVEIGLCGALPAAVLLIGRLRRMPAALHLACLLACAGVAMNRYLFTVQTQAVPVMPFDEWRNYIPGVYEWAVTALALAVGAAALSLAYRYLPVFPQEKFLNPPRPQ